MHACNACIARARPTRQQKQKQEEKKEPLNPTINMGTPFVFLLFLVCLLPKNKTHQK